MKSFLFIPGDSAKKMDKGMGSSADALILDLEDSVAAGNKRAARDMSADFLKAHKDASDGPALFVRINAFDTGLAEDDIAAIVAAGPAGLVLPKSDSGADVQKLSALIAAAEAEAGIEDGKTLILPIATETPSAVFNLGTYAGSSARLCGLSWGAEDLSAAIGAQANRDENGVFTTPFQLVRNLCLMGATAANADPIDTVYTAFRNDEGLRRECLEAQRDGFTGKLAIHPAQVAIINEIFTPSEAAIADAREIIGIFATSGDGVAGRDGEMLDKPHLVRAQRILARAGLEP